MYQIAIVEDEENSIQKMKKYIQRYMQERDILLKVDVFRDGLNFVSDYSLKYDLILLDIEMPHMDGMTAAYKIREIDEEVCLIFVTNLIQYAVEGYAVKAMDFLVKPVEYENLAIKLDKAFHYRERFKQNEIIINGSKGMLRIKVDELLYIEILNHTLVYHTKKGVAEERGSISKKEAELEKFGFARCNNSFLVNLRYVTAVENGAVRVKDQLIPIGRTKKKDFMDKLTKFMGIYL